MSGCEKGGGTCEWLWGRGRTCEWLLEGLFGSESWIRESGVRDNAQRGNNDVSEVHESM